MDVFLACPISMDPMEVESYKVEVEGVLGREGGLNVVPSSTHFERTFHEAGSWSNWIEQVAKGKKYGGGGDIFQVYVVPDVVVGRATAQIVGMALSVGKPVVVLFRRTLTEIHRVTGVTITDEENWQAGWNLTLAQQADRIDK